MLSAKEPQSAGALLPFWRANGDHLLHLDGRVTGGFELRGLALDCFSEELHERHQGQLKMFLHALPREAEIQFVYQVRPLSPILSRFKSETEEACDKFRFIWEGKSAYYERESNIWHTRLYLFTSLPPPEADSGASFLQMISRSFRRTNLSKTLQETSAYIDRREADLHRTISEIRMALSFLELPARELTSREIETILYETLNPARSAKIPYQKLGGPDWAKTSLLRDELVFSNIQAHPREMILDDQIHRILTLKDIPQIQYAGIINRLLTLREFPFNLSVGLKQESPDEMLGSLKRAEILQKNLQKGRGRNYEAEESQRTLSEVIQSLVRGDVKVFKLSFTIHYWGRDEKELAHNESLLRQEIHQMGEAKELREEFTYPELFIASLPGLSYRNYRLLNTITPQTLSLLPIYQSHRGSSRPVALFKNRTDELVGLDPFNSNLSAFNGIIFGPTGRGKSFLAQYLLLQYLRLRPRLFIIDVGGSYRRFTSLIGGTYVELRHDSGISLNPFLPCRGEPEPEFLGFLAGVVERMVKNPSEERLGQEAQSLIRDTIRSLYSEKKHPLNFEGFRLAMVERSNWIADPEDQVLLKRLARRMSLWTEGEGKRLLVSGKPLSLETPVITIDLAGLSSNKELLGVTLQILAGLIWYQVQKAAGPKIVLFDEVWQHLKDPTAAQLIDQLYRTSRKHHASVLSISQQLEDFLQFQSSIIANSATRFILRTDRELARLKEVFQLNETELELIHGLTMRRGYFSEIFAAIGDDHLVLRVEPSPYEYWLCTTHPDDLIREREFREKNPESSLQETLQALAQEYPRGVL